LADCLRRGGCAVSDGFPVKVSGKLRPGEYAVDGGVSAPYGKGCAEALDYVLALAARLGFRTKNCDRIIGWAEIGAGDELIGILTHLDVVPAGDGWICDPFGGEIRDGKLYGRGVVDDKGPAIMCLYAMKALLDSGVALKRRVRIIFGQNEERGHWTDIDHYLAHEEIPVYGFTPDADFPAIYCEKGIAQFELTMPLNQSGVLSANGGLAVNMVPDFCAVTLADGRRFEAAGKSAHGSVPAEGINAIGKTMFDIGQNAPDCSFAKFYNDTIGFAYDGSKMSCALSDEQSGALTLNAGKLTADENGVALSIDIRHPICFSAEDIFRKVSGRVEPYGVAVSFLSVQHSVYLDRNSALMGKLLSVYREVTGDHSEPIIIGGGTYARAMPNIVAFGPMLPGRERTEHQRDENIPLEDFNIAYEIYCRALKRLAVE
jgi:succinyl-diaminopimelate desuccinylase